MQNNQPKVYQLLFVRRIDVLIVWTNNYFSMFSCRLVMIWLRLLPRNCFRRQVCGTYTVHYWHFTLFFIQKVIWNAIQRSLTYRRRILGAYFPEQFYQLSLSVFVICEGMSPNDVQVVELHDCFSTNELLTYEGLGLCSEGMMGYSLSICYLVLA